MSAIQSSVGLVSGIPIQDTVDQLIALAARPRDLLAGRTQSLSAERAAVDTLASLTLGLQAAVNRFNASSTFQSQTATSSKPDLVATSVTGTPSIGSYQLTPLRLASSHQLVSGSFADLTDSIGDGVLKLRFGGHVDKGVDLSQLNGGEGFEAGRIKITDRDGLSAVIDLRAAQTVDDVLEAINSNSDIDVTASVDGDRFVLTDNSGGSGNLRVREVSDGATAASLGLAEVSVAADTATGNDVYGLALTTQLATLNDGLGARARAEGIDDLDITLRDGTQGFVDLAGATTLGGVIDAINNDEDFAGALTAQINSAGDGLDLIDSSGGSGDLIVAEVGGGSAAADLGIGGTVSASTLGGERIVSGLKDTLVRTLNGGLGLTLGEIALTDRSGASATIDLSGLETLGEVIGAINAEGSIGVRAAINSSRGGLEIVDTSGGAGSLVVADSGGTTTASDLGLVIDAAVNSVDGGSLRRQSVGSSTLLSDFNGGKGVSQGDFKVTDSQGVTLAVDLTDAVTVGDVIDRVNEAATTSSAGITASINEAGDGVLLTDTAGGQGKLTVVEVGNGSAAADLNLLGAATGENGSGQQVIDGTTSYSVDLSDLDQEDNSIALASLNGGAGVDLSVFRITVGEDDERVDLIVDLGETGDEAFTVGDVIDKINEAAGNRQVNVSARVNDAGTGILLTDGTGKEGQLTVEDLAGGTGAADLNLIRTPADTLDNQIDGAGLFDADSAEKGALEALVTRVNALGAGVTASVFQDAGGFRLSLTADETGSANELLIDTGTTGFSFIETSRPRDAVALLGGENALGGIAVTSSSNEFEGVIDGLGVTLQGATGESTTINVASDNQPIVDVVQDFVDAYNSIRSSLDTLTDFDEETLTTGILFGRNEALRVDTELARIVTGAFSVSGSINNLESLGIGVDADGRLSLDTGRLESALSDDRASVEAIFTDEQGGLVSRMTEAIDQLAGGANSLLSSRSDALGNTIDGNNDRIDLLNERLEVQRDQLLLEFVRLEETIALIQSNNSLIESIVPIQIQTRSSNN